MGNPTASVIDDVSREPGSGIRELRRRADQPTMIWGISPIESLMLVTLLGLLVATLFPELLRTQVAAQQKSVQTTVEAVRRQIAHFREHHQGRLPAQGTDSAEQFVDQLFRRTTISGRVAADGRFGPYLLGEFPMNPYVRSSVVLVVAGPLEQRHWQGESDHGWAYSSTTGEFRANVSDADMPRR
ncbi:MAG: hypothetical protein ACYTGL_14555 [Planctomycetota bacterium]|jgi:type II secretory pathway pseudopilin PulG